MAFEENKDVFVQYLFPDIAPKKGFKTMRYYTSFMKNSQEFYLGFNNKIKYKKNKLEDLVDKNELIKLPQAIILPYKKNLFLNKNGNIVMISGYLPNLEEELILELKL